MGVFQIESKKLPLDYDNDRIILILLSLKANKTFGERRRCDHLKKRYEDNGVYEDDIIAKLITAGYVREIDLEPHNPKQSNTGSIIHHNVEYTTSESGCRALKEGRFISEYRSAMWKRAGSGLQWGVSVLSIIGGIMGVYAACKNVPATAPPTTYETINAADSIIITPDTAAVFKAHSDSSKTHSDKFKCIQSDKKTQSSSKEIDATKTHPTIK